MAGLLDFLQSASNSAAGNVSAPVDGIAWLLRKAGIPVPDAPMGGSDWMQQQGLTRPVQQSAQSLAGETMGLLGPIGAAAKAPQIARGLLAVGENAAIPRAMNPQAGAVVWHGSPHKFDAFDSSKIGTGEGAQSYGHGLYLAEHPDVANSYQKALAPERNANDLNKRMKLAQVGNRPLDSFGVDMSQELIDAAKVGGQPFIDLATQKRARWADLASDKTYPFRDYAAEKLTAYDSLLNEAKNSSIEYTGGGNIYKVDLPDNAIAKMLDYDNPISEAMRKPLSTAALDQFGSGLTGTSGEKLYKEMIFNFKQAGHPNPAQAATDWLTQQGVPGMRYLDGGSRSAGAGTSNYVLFPGNEGLLSILERNGQPIK